MSVNSRPGNRYPRFEIPTSRERAGPPVVRHVARGRSFRGDAVDSGDSLTLLSASPGSSLAEQAREIIDFILDDPDPGLAEIRNRLRIWVDAYPDFPARALLEHLIETCSQTNNQRQPQNTPAPVIAHRAAPH